MGWIPSPLGVFKLNFDGSSLGNLGPSGFGCVIQDSQGEIIRIIAGRIGFVDSTKAEVLGLLMGLREIHNLNLHGSLVEGDSKVVVGPGLGCSSSFWKHAQLIHEIIDLVHVLNINLIHIPRSQNGLADRLAK